MSKLIRPESENHPSYGCVCLSRVTSSQGMSLFGSSIKHSNVIRLRVNRASLRRNYHEDRHSSEGSIVEVDFSPAQFAEMITSAGIGEGVPCTIRRLNNESIPEPRFDSKREQFANEFKGHTDEVALKFNGLIAEMAEMAEKSTVGKKERQEFLKKLRMLKQDVECNTPFIAEQFNEQMDKTVHEAKVEVEAFVSDLVIRTGLEAIKRGPLALE